MGEFTLFDGMDPGYFFIIKTIGMKDDIKWLLIASYSDCNLIAISVVLLIYVDQSIDIFYHNCVRHTIYRIKSVD